MNRSLKKFFGFVGCFALLLLFSTNVFAATLTYSTSAMKIVKTAINISASNLTISCNTRPSTGEGGALVKITKTDGTVMASKTFPYQTSISNLTASLPASTIREIRIGAKISSQTVSGTLTYSY